MKLELISKSDNDKKKLVVEERVNIEIPGEYKHLILNSLQKFFDNVYNDKNIFSSNSQASCCNGVEDAKDMILVEIDQIKDKPCLKRSLDKDSKNDSCSRRKKMKSSVYKSFDKTIDTIIHQVKYVEKVELDESCPAEALIEDLEKLMETTKKLNEVGGLASVAVEKLVKLLVVLELNIRGGCDCSLISDSSDGDEDRKMFLKLALKRVSRAVDASLASLYILTSQNIDNRIFLEDAIERILTFTKFQLGNTICHTHENKISSKEKNIISVLTNKITDIIVLLKRLIEEHTLSDSSILKASHISVAALFTIKDNYLSISAFDLFFVIFIKYETQKRNMLDLVLSCIDTLHVADGNCIKMVSSLILQVVQSIKLDMKTLTCEVIELQFLEGKKIASYFLTNLLTKCENKKENFKIVENFLGYFLNMLNSPEWPAAEVFLVILGKILVSKVLDNSVEQSLKAACLGFLSEIATKLIKEAEAVKNLVNDGKLTNVHVITKDKTNIEEICLEQEVFMKKLILDFLTSKGHFEVKNFYFLQWFHDSANEAKSKDVVLSQIKTLDNFREAKDGKMTNYKTAQAVTRYIASRRSFSQIYNFYLKLICKKFLDPVASLRSKAMKCLTLIIETEPSVLTLKEVYLSVSSALLDQSASVRESAMNLIGTLVLSRTEFIPTYYGLLSARMLDTSIAVRKKSIKIVREICYMSQNFKEFPDTCFKFLKLVDDESSVKKLVIEFFQKIWFTPVDQSPLDSDSLVKKVMDMTYVVSCLKHNSIHLMENLLNMCELDVDLPCSQVIGCIEAVLQTLETEDNVRFVACFTLINIISKKNPLLVSNHLEMLQKYLTSKNDSVVSYVTSALDVVVPCVSDPDKDFLTNLEQNLSDLVYHQEPSVVTSCLSCLGTIVNNVTKNYKFIQNFFITNYKFLLNYRNLVDERNGEMLRLLPQFKRSVFNVGLLLRFFDLKNFVNDSKNIVNGVYSAFMFFLSRDECLHSYALKALGAACVRHSELMLCPETKSIFIGCLLDGKTSASKSYQVLASIRNFLTEEEKKMQVQDTNWREVSKKESLKEMNDITSGLASTVAQMYLKGILNAIHHVDNSVRNCACQVVELILSQGLVHPLPIVPHLICLSTDKEMVVCTNANKYLETIESKYPGYVHTSFQCGLKLSYRYQKKFQPNGIVRGFRMGAHPVALNGHCFSIIRVKNQKRAAILSMLKQFEEKKIHIYDKFYIADNIAHFTYQEQDDLLFVIHHINIFLSFYGANFLQSFQEALAPKEEDNPEDDDDNEETLLQRVPDDTTVLNRIMSESQEVFLLGSLKLYLKDVYGLTDLKIKEYSPAAKTHSAAIKRKHNLNFDSIKVLANSAGNQPKKQLVSEYIAFKKIYMSLDPDGRIAEEKQTSPSCDTEAKGNKKIEMDKVNKKSKKSKSRK